jgi:2-dehydro-3-deoxyglucarate aldolase/4-hydroxy-2-oxoheptanedioate aldolase
MIWEFSSRGMAKILEYGGADFVLLDMEHSGIELERVADQIAWFKATAIAPFVRVPQRLYHFLARVMDAGALGVMVANVESGAEAREIVNAVKYAPGGGRGLGLGHAHNEYAPPDPVAYMEEANRNTTIICQIESAKGLANIEEIAATPGVDCLWVGHFDLTQSMGIVAQFQHPRFLEALRIVVDTARRHQKLAGIQPGNAAQAEQWMKTGFNIISWGADAGVYREALKSGIETVRRLGQA